MSPSSINEWMNEWMNESINQSTNHQDSSDINGYWNQFSTTVSKCGVTICGWILLVERLCRHMVLVCDWSSLPPQWCHRPQPHPLMPTKLSSWHSSSTNTVSQQEHFVGSNGFAGAPHISLCGIHGDMRGNKSWVMSTNPIMKWAYCSTKFLVLSTCQLWCSG